MTKLTHFDDQGAAHMVEVGGKAETERVAVAAGAIEMSRATLALVRAGAAKGDVLGVARVAAIGGAKRTSELIPLCHPVRLTSVDVELTVVDADAGSDVGRVDIRVTARAFDRTGVEMEALTAVTVAALTIYDMLKAVERGMRVVDIRLVSKSGGRSGLWSSGVT